MALRIGLLLLLPVAACAPRGPDVSALQMMQHSLAATRASLAAVDPASAPPAHVEPVVLELRSGAAPHRQAGTAPPTRAADLVGATDDALRRALGEPNLRRPEGPGEVWLYEGPDCHLDVILYRDGQGPLRVAFAAARASGTERRTEAGCLRGIAAPEAARPLTIPTSAIRAEAPGARA